MRGLGGSELTVVNPLKSTKMQPRPGSSHLLTRAGSRGSAPQSVYFVRLRDPTTNYTGHRRWKGRG